MSRYIDAEEVEKRIDVVIGSEPKAWDKKALKELKMYIVHAVPSADVRENVRGEWIDDGIHGDWAWETDGHGVCWQIWKCSRCGRGTKIRSNYCPNCGAKMSREESDNG